MLLDFRLIVLLSSKSWFFYFQEIADESLEAQRRMASSPYAPEHQGENEQIELASLLRDCGAQSVSQLR